MSNFKKAVEKSGIIQRLEWQLETLQQVEIRQMVAIACYEAMLGGLPEPLLRGVNEALQGRSFADRSVMYAELVGTAKMLWTELEFEQASRELDAQKVSESSEGSSPHSLPVILPSASGTSGS